MLTMEQKQKLIDASSGLPPDQFSKLNLEEQQEVMNRINEVVAKLKQESPELFN